MPYLPLLEPALLTLFGGALMGVAVLWRRQVRALEIKIARAARAARDQADALKDNEVLLRGIFEHAPQAILVVDQTGCIVRANDHAALIFGQPLSQLIGGRVESLMPEHLRDSHHANLTDYFVKPRFGIAMTQRPVYGLRGGEVFPLEIFLSHIQVAGQRLVVAMATDISRRNAVEQSLRESEQRFRTIMENAPIGMAIMSLDGYWLEVNQAVCEITGYRADELAQLRFQDVTHPDDLAEDLDRLDALMVGDIASYQMEKRYERKDGSHVWVLLAVSLVRSSRGEPRYFIAQIKNVDERRRAEDALRKALALQSSIVNSAPTSIISTDARGLIVSFNAAAQRMFQYAEAEVVGRMTPIRLHDPAELRARALELRDEIGREVPPGLEAIVAHVRAGRAEQREWTYVRKDGSRLPVLLSVTALRDELGAITGFLGIGSDISGQKRHEVQMREALNEKETLLREVYHRVKNNLQVVSSLVNLQLRTLPPGAARSALAEAAERVRAMALVHEKLYQSPSLSAIDLGGYIEELVARLAVSSGAAERGIDVHCASAPLQIGLDTAVPLGLIVNELFSNASKHAFPDGRRGRIEVDVSLSDSGIRLVVQDDGQGLSAGRADLLSGSLGLKLVRSLSSQLDAVFGIETNGGTRATLVLPLSRVVV